MWKFAKSWTDFKKWIWLPLVVIATLIFIVIGASNSYSVEIVDQEARASTLSMQPTGAFDVVETAQYLCEPGEDYVYCINVHIAMYNSVCVKQALSDAGLLTCSSLLSFIDSIKSEADECGYGCTTGGEGDWGWPSLRLEAETASMSNNDAQPRLTHIEHCSFDLGIIQIGTCLERGQ